MKTTTSKINNLVGNMTYLLGIELSNAFPDVKTGDFTPDALNEFDIAIRAAVSSWLEENAPNELVRIELEETAIELENKIQHYQELLVNVMGDLDVLV